MMFILAEVNAYLDDKVYQLWTYERALLSRNFAVIYFCNEDLYGYQSTYISLDTSHKLM